jgi:hypothetical protein
MRTSIGGKVLYERHSFGDVAPHEGVAERPSASVSCATKSVPTPKEARFRRGIKRRRVDTLMVATRMHKWPTTNFVICATHSDEGDPPPTHGQSLAIDSAVSQLQTSVLPKRPHSPAARLICWMDTLERPCELCA